MRRAMSDCGESNDINARRRNQPTILDYLPPIVRGAGRLYQFGPGPGKTMRHTSNEQAQKNGLY